MLVYRKMDNEQFSSCSLLYINRELFDFYPVKQHLGILIPKTLYHLIPIYIHKRYYRNGILLSSICGPL